MLFDTRIPADILERLRKTRYRFTTPSLSYLLIIFISSMKLDSPSFNNWTCPSPFSAITLWTCEIMLISCSLDDKHMSQLMVQGVSRVGQL